MNSPELGVGLVCALTFLGLAPWLLSASWRGSRLQASLIIFCTSAQLVVSILSLYYSSYILLTFSAVLLAAYIWAGYVGAERFSKDTHNA